MFFFEMLLGTIGNFLIDIADIQSIRKIIRGGRIIAIIKECGTRHVVFNNIWAFSCDRTVRLRYLYEHR